MRCWRSFLARADIGGTLGDIKNIDPDLLEPLTADEIAALLKRGQPIRPQDCFKPKPSDHKADIDLINERKRMLIADVLQVRVNGFRVKGTYPKPTIDLRADAHRMLMEWRIEAAFDEIAALLKRGDNSDA